MRSERVITAHLVSISMGEGGGASNNVELTLSPVGIHSGYSRAKSDVLYYWL